MCMVVSSKVSPDRKSFLTKMYMPICIRSCPVKWPFNENPFLQNLHVNDFSCLVKTPFRENQFPHILHWNNFSAACVHSCRVKFPFMENTLSQN